MTKNYKKFVIYFFVSLHIMVILHYFTWIKFTSHVLLIHDNIYTGDLGRMSLYPDSAFPRPAYPSKDSVNLLKEHITFNTWYKKQDNIDVLTLGDSFSNAATQGINPFYQDYIATYNDFQVLNINVLSKTKNYLESIALLNNSGVLDIMKPKYIILESVERFSINRFAVDTNFEINDTYDNVIAELKRQKSPYLGKDDDIKFINDKNFVSIKNNLFYSFFEQPFGSKSYKVKLKDDFFTSKDRNSLFFYKGDIDALFLSTHNNIEKLNDNFNQLAEILSKKGIRLVFMPAVDKYNLYSNYIIDNEYPSSLFFERLRPLEKKYSFIDTKSILLKELEKGTKDLYYSDDTHWSYKAADVLFRDFKF